MGITKNEQGYYKMLEFPPGSIQDLYARQGIEMTVVHNIFLRALNSILYHTPKVTQKDIPSFMKYCQALGFAIHHHHTNEEELHFPLLEKKMGKGAMSTNIAGHEAFHGPFDEFRALVDKIAANPSTWDPKPFLAAVAKFADPLTLHLYEEIGTLDAEILKKTLTIEDLDHCNKEVEKNIQQHYGLTTVLPLFIVNQDNISGGWLLPIPWIGRAIVAWGIVPWGAQWKYGTATGWGDLKPEFSWMACPPWTP